MQPTRAGIIGLWDYTDHVFDFAGGRLVLRGANGSGKTKALEVLFPFVLDGRLDARRLDPFSGENRTMKENLLWGRGGESGYGYAWLEFGDGTRFVTVGVGMVARRSQPSPTPWFFVADGRVGEEVVLVEPDGRPRTRVQLRDALGPDVVVERARDHRARVDAALFGLGADRYEAMLDLVLTLRRPMLAKDLDPALLSETLTRGLRPLDDELLEQVARTFDDLERVQLDLERVVAADEAAQAFLTDYRGYLRTQARARADAAIEAEAGRATAADRLDRALAAVDRTRAEEAMAEAEHGAVEDSLATARARRDALRSSEAFRSIGQLDHLTGFVADLARGRAGAEATAAARASDAEVAGGEAETAERRAAEATAEARRLRQRVTDSASAAGAPWDDPGEEADAGAVRTAASAARTARRADLDAVGGLLAAVDDADRRLGVAEEEIQAASSAVEEATTELAGAEAALAGAREALVGVVGTWAAAHTAVVEPADAEAVAAAVADLGEPGAGPSPVEVWRSRLEERRAAATDRRAELRARTRELAAQDEALRTRRDAIAAETDDAPPPLPWRGNGRDGRPGAPLWRLVRFRPEVGEGEAAGVEAALEAAGLLDAWVPPDGAVETTGEAEPDAWLAPAAAAGGPTLATVLEVETQDAVPAAVVERLLGSIGVSDGEGPVAITTAGGYRLGPLAGRHEVESPRYIGATARAAHRARRIADLDRELAELAAEIGAVDAAVAEVEAWLAAAADATAAVPAPTPVLDAARHRDVRAGELTGARRRVVDATAAAERWRREGNDHRAARDREAARRGLPTTAAALAEVAAALSRFADDAGELAAGIDRAADRTAAAATARQRAIAATAEAQRAAEWHEDRRREHAAKEEELRVLTERLGPAAAAVQVELEEVDAAIASDEDRERSLATRRRDAAAARGQAEGEQQAAEEAVGQADERVAATGRHLHVLRRPDLAAPLGLAVPAPEDDAELVTAVDDLVTGVSATDERRKAAHTRVLGAFESLQRALGGGYHPAWDVEDDVIVVTVGDDRGSRSASSFAAELRSQREDQEVLLHERERALFEDTLLSAVCRQIHQRVVATRDLVAAMDAEMRARRLSSGQTVGVAWRSADALTPEWKEVQRLLDTDPAHLAPDQLEVIRRHFASEIAAARRGDREVPYRELLARVLDYRAWRRFELTLVEADGAGAPLTKARHARLSGGEKAASLHLPLFAAAHAAFAAARPDCPRLLALDEAFAGIDDQGRAELLSLTVAFDLDLFMTGFDLWAVHPAVPAVAHHDLLHLVDERVVSSLLVLWNGRELIEGPDADEQLALLRDGGGG